MIATKAKLNFSVNLTTRILNDSFVTVISGPAEELERFAKVLECEMPHKCGWLTRARSSETGRFIKGYSE